VPSTRSLQGLLDGWRHFVIQVEQEYEYSIYEYTNDLSIRDLLKEILSKAPQTLREKLIQEIRMWDNRFQEATQEISRPVVPRADHDLPSWWFRIPRNLKGELAEDLRAEGVLE
jgi:ribosomal protein L16 Arg81 hydroxylase